MPTIDAVTRNIRSRSSDVREPTLAAVAKLDGEALFALRERLYQGDWQGRRAREPRFLELLTAVEARYQELGGTGYERHVRGPLPPARMELGEVYEEIWRLQDAKARHGIGDDGAARLAALWSHLDAVAKANHIRSGNALAMRIRASLDD